MSQQLKIAIVVVLVLLNVSLVILVRDKMADSRADAARAKPLPPPPASAASLTPEQPSRPGGPQSLTIARDDAIFRVYGGSCDGNDTAGITVSTDSGATFDDVGLPEDMRAVFMVTADDVDTLDLVAAGEECVPTRFVSTDGGENWEAAEGADVWFLGPKERVTAPVGVVEPGCTETLTLSAPNPDTARVFCASGVLIGTTDAGETWARLGSLDGVKAAAYATPRRGYALAPDGGCATGSYATENAGRSWTAVGCLDAAPGRALAANRNLVAAIAGDAVYVSEDGGRTWTKA